MYKRILSLLIVAFLMFTMSFPIFAASTDTYTHVDLPDGSMELHLSKEMYRATKIIDARTLGLDESLKGISDVFCPGDGTTYIIFSESSKIIVLDSNYNLFKQILPTDLDGSPINFTGAQGIYCDKDGNIYIADTQNSRVLVTNAEGQLTNTILTPKSKLIPDGFLFQPTKLAKDSNGYLYILSLGCYYGALMYNPDNEFIGFYGSNNVESSALDTIQYLWEKLTSNDVKKKASVKTLPYSFVDFDFDSKDYLITCTGQTDTKNNDVGQIRKISYNGANILYKRNASGEYNSSSSVNYLEEQLVLKEDRTGSLLAQDMVSVAVDSDNYIYALDRVNGYIYVYDNESNFLNVFGGGFGQGNQVGTFSTPMTIELRGEDIIVSDIKNMSLTVFEITEYGKTLKHAQTLYLKGDYDEAESLWNKVLSYDADNQLAYRGLAMIAYNKGDYKTAMEYAEIGVDFSVYDLAKQEVTKNYIADNFLVIILFVLLLIGAIVFLVVYLKKKDIVLLSNVKAKTVFKTPIHPFDTFNDIKYKKTGSVLIAVILTVLLYIAFFLRDTASGFLYSAVDMRSYNSIYTIAKTIGLVLFWALCNWLVCSMASGKGTLKEVYIVTAYSLLPLILYSFIRVVLTNFLPLSASGIISGVDTAVWILTFFLLIIGTMIVHEYDFFRFLLTGVVTILLMILFLFVIFICALMSKQAITFITSVYNEFVYR